MSKARAIPVSWESVTRTLDILCSSERESAGALGISYQNS